MKGKQLPVQNNKRDLQMSRYKENKHYKFPPPVQFPDRENEQNFS